MDKLLFRIGLEEVKIFAFVGYYQEEQVLGNNFLVNVYVDLAAADVNDELKNTINYETLYQVIRNAFSMPSKLLETVAAEILSEIKKIAPKSHFIEISIRKENPPMVGEIKNALVKLIYQNELI